MAAGRLAGQRIEIPAVPGAADPALSVAALFDAAFAERSALMRAVVVHGRPLAVEMRERPSRPCRRLRS